MKIVSYCIFGLDKTTSENRFEFYAYLRGLYFNARMNRLLYPGWKTHIEADAATYQSNFRDYFDMLVHELDVSLRVNQETAPLCKAMLRRLRPLFTAEATHVLCRDADSITTYREAQAVQGWLNRGRDFHAITDNPYHNTPMMGGMIGFKTAKFRALFPWQSWEEMVGICNAEWSNKGRDQDFLCSFIYPVIRKYMHGHFLDGSRNSYRANLAEFKIPAVAIPGVDPSLWEANLTARHIGGAGFIELEALRFLKRFDAAFSRSIGIEKRFPQIFYWAY